MIRRATDAERMNYIANHPAVHPCLTMPGQGAINLSQQLADPRNYGLLGEHGAMFFKYITMGFYDIHTLMLPEGRGKLAIPLINECMYWMFTHSDAVEMVTRVPRSHKAARVMLQSVMGNMLPRISLEKGWADENGPVRADIFRLHIEDWAQRTPELSKVGEWFHHRLNDEYGRLGKPVLPHTDDPGHDSIVGLTVEMLRAGQYGKGLNYYNRWAAVTGQHQIKLANNDPVVIDTGDDRLLLQGNTFEVVP